jgi:hypothetical protein
MDILVPAVTAVILGSLGLRLWYVKWRRRRVATRRRVEAPNSYYSSQGVRNQEDRERWGQIELTRLHSLNRDEVSRLLAIVDAEGIGALSRKDRVFLDNMALPRVGV